MSALMVTISTRVRRFDALKSIVEAHPNVFCSIGTHPHNAAEEPDVTVEELVEIARIPRWSRSARRGSTITTITARAMCSRRASAPISPPRGNRPAARHPCARGRCRHRPHSRGGEQKGAFPFVLHCFTSGAELARTRACARRLCLVLRRRHLQECRRAPRHRARRAPRPSPGRDRRALPCARADAGKDQRACFRRPYRGATCGLARSSARTTWRAYHGQFLQTFQKVPRVVNRCRKAPHEFESHHSRLRHIGRRPAYRQPLGRVRSRRSQEPALALRAARGAQRAPKADDGVWSTPRPTCASSCSTPGSPARRRALHPRPRRPHARHRRSAPGRLQRPSPGRRLLRRGDAADAPLALRLLLRDAARQRISARSSRATRSARRDGRISQARAGRSKRCRSGKSTGGRDARLPFRRLRLFARCERFPGGVA